MVLGDIAAQRTDVMQAVEKRLYEVVGKVYELGLKAERFDRVKDYAQEIAIVPVSAKTGAGLPELLMILCALTQKYLEQNLEVNTDDPGKATVLEVKEDVGLGRTIDLILYDGCIKVNDTIVIGTMGEPVVTKVRSLLQPKEHHEMMDRKSKYDHIKIALAATGVKVAAPHMDEVISGMPVRVVRDPALIDSVKKELKSEVQDISIELDPEGIIVKADNVGSLEATVTLLREHDIKVRKVGVGKVSKRDINDVLANLDKGDEYAAILGFNIIVPKDIDIPDGVTVLTDTVVYKLIEDYVKWDEERKKKKEAAMLDSVVRPFKVKVLPKCIFRQSQPLVCGVEVLGGVLKPGVSLMKSDRSKVPAVKSMEDNKKNVTEAKMGDQLALAIPGAVAEKHVFENDILYSFISENDFRTLKLLKKHLIPEEVDILKEIAEIWREENEMWGK
jgi:translation initiation factor 5B